MEVIELDTGKQSFCRRTKILIAALLFLIHLDLSCCILFQILVAHFRVFLLMSMEGYKLYGEAFQLRSL